MVVIGFGGAECIRRNNKWKKQGFFAFFLKKFLSCLLYFILCELFKEENLVSSGFNSDEDGKRQRVMRNIKFCPKFYY